MFYALVRALVGMAIRLFYRVEVVGPPAPASGPVLFLGNHPNALVNPALVFVVTDRQVTFMAKAPLFKTPVVGWLLKGLNALPVYQNQDNPSDMSKNEGTFEAATSALTQARALMLFPEGRSHSEPSLAELKTGAAAIAFRAAQQGAPVQLVPVGLTYADKGRLRSRVRVELGPALAVAPWLPTTEEGEPEAVRSLTAEIAGALRKVTLNLEAWEDLPVLKTAEALYALRQGERHGDADRLRRFARGMVLLREQEPEQYLKLRREVESFGRRCELVQATPGDLGIVYQRGAVYSFTIRNLVGLLMGLPLFLLGVVLFFIPFQIPRVLARVLKLEPDTRATAKFLATLLISPIWQVLLVSLAYWRFGLWPALVTLFGSVPLAMFTRYFSAPGWGLA